MYGSPAVIAEAAHVVSTAKGPSLRARAAFGRSNPVFKNPRKKWFGSPRVLRGLCDNVVNFFAATTCAELNLTMFVLSSSN